MTDCWRRCIARLADVPHELVPNFVAEDPEFWLADTAGWLQAMGLQLVAMVSVADGAGIEVLKHAQPIGRHIEVGTIEGGTFHAVVREVDGSVWDPMPSSTGLVTVLGLYWVVNG